MAYTKYCFFFSSRRRHTRLQGDWSSDVCSSDLDGTRFGRREHGNAALQIHGNGRDHGERSYTFHLRAFGIVILNRADDFDGQTGDSELDPNLFDRPFRESRKHLVVDGVAFSGGRPDEEVRLREWLI